MDNNFTSPCLNLGGMCSGQGPINVLRSGKDVMPYRQGAVLTTYMHDYIPPVIMPGYQDQLPGVATCFGNTYRGGVSSSNKFFNTYRNDVLAQQVRPKFLYGRLPCDFTPFPDVAMAGRSIRWSKLSETPNIRPTNVDINRSAQLRNFHEKCMAHRDYYTDKTERVHPEEYFYLGKPYPVRCPVDEREFKIGDGGGCDVVGGGMVGPPLRCNAMPCIKHHGMLEPFIHPKLPRPPFQCWARKRKDLSTHEVLLI